MAQSQHAHDHDPTDRQPRGTDRYCAYCGKKQPDDRVATRRLEPTFCDDACESAWNIDATVSPGSR